MNFDGIASAAVCAMERLPWIANNVWDYLSRISLQSTYLSLTAHWSDSTDLADSGRPLPLVSQLLVMLACETFVFEFCYALLDLV